MLESILYKNGSATFQVEGGERDDEDMDEEDWEVEEEVGEEEEEKKEETEEDEEMIRPSENKFRCLFISAQRNTPQFFVRYDWVPLKKHIYLSLRKQWRQLLAGERTYLRPQRLIRVLDDVFKCPDPRPRTLGCQVCIRLYHLKTFPMSFFSVPIHTSCLIR